MGSFRKYGVWFEGMQFFYSFRSVKLILIYCVAGWSHTMLFSHHVKFYRLYDNAQDFHLIGLCKINGNHPCPHVGKHVSRSGGG